MKKLVLFFTFILSILASSCNSKPEPPTVWSGQLETFDQAPEWVSGLDVGYLEGWVSISDLVVDKASYMCWAVQPPEQQPKKWLLTFDCIESYGPNWPPDGDIMASVRVKVNSITSSCFKTLNPGFFTPSTVTVDLMPAIHRCLATLDKSWGDDLRISIKFECIAGYFNGANHLYFDNAKLEPVYYKQLHHE